MFRVFIVHSKSTTIDRIYRYISLNGDANVTGKLQQFLKHQEYDTDAVENDVCGPRRNSNIAQVNQQTWIFIREYNHLSKRMLHHLLLSSCHFNNLLHPSLVCTEYKQTFSSGYRFYYWYSYKRDEKCTDSHILQFKPPKASTLYVSNKYHGLKEELLQNKLHTLNQHKFSMFYNKAQQYLESVKVRKSITVCDDYLHYGI